MIIDLVKANRSYRRFHESTPVSRETLAGLINLGRLSPTGANRQALKYFISCEPQQNAKVFPALGWAAYLSEWVGPEPGERPSAYIVMVQDQGFKMVSSMDPGIAAQSILLGATEIGLGGCMIGTVNHSLLRQALNIPEQYEIVLVIALGKPKEKVVIDEIGPDGDIKYWRDENRVHHVPKRKLTDIIVN